MTKTALAAATAVAVLLTGGMAGIFLAFSVAVMPGLNAARASAAVEAMQQINQKILNPVFLVHFSGAPLAAAAAGVLLLVAGQRQAGVLFLAAAAVYVLGVIGPTAAVNVPMNDALDAAGNPAGASEAARIWGAYTGRWTAWNTLRGVASSVSLLLMALGLYVWGRDA